MFSWFSFPFSLAYRVFTIVPKLSDLCFYVKTDHLALWFFLAKLFRNYEYTSATLYAE